MLSGPRWSGTVPSDSRNLADIQGASIPSSLWFHGKPSLDGFAFIIVTLFLPVPVRKGPCVNMSTRRSSLWRDPGQAADLPGTEQITPLLIWGNCSVIVCERRWYIQMQSNLSVSISFYTATDIKAFWDACSIQSLRKSNQLSVKCCEILQVKCGRREGTPGPVLSNTWLCLLLGCSMGHLLHDRPALTSLSAVSSSSAWGKM